MGKEIYRNRVIAITGHRPDKLGGYSEDIYRRLVEMYVHVFKDLRPARVISGMALGADQAAAEAALELGIPVTAAVPFAGQESKWPPQSQVRYRSILAGCDRVVVVSDGGYSAEKMHHRNEWMVDRANIIIALYDGSSGGTANCVNYARQNQVHVINIWDRWAGR